MLPQSSSTSMPCRSTPIAAIPPSSVSYSAGVIDAPCAARRLLHQ
ncbi:hypothetical protein [Amycolatopsis sp. MtRt-6]|nr:hypothetical protein [Amycolatopsis sp. MtRt-6]